MQTRLPYALALVAACAGTGRSIERPAPRCPAPLREPTAPVEALAGPDLAGRRIAAIEVAGVSAPMAARARSEIRSAAGARVDRERIAADLRRLWRLEIAEQIAVFGRPRGRKVALVFEITPRRIIGEVLVRGAPPRDRGHHRRRLARLAGTLFDRGRVHDEARAIEDAWRADGHLDARVATSVFGDRRAPSVCFALAPGPRYTIRRLAFRGNRRVSDEALAAAMSGDGANKVGGVLARDLLDRNLLELSALYYDRGHVDVRIGEPIIDVDRRRGAISVTIPIDEGPVFRLGRVRITGALADQARRYLAAASLEPGAVFSRSEIHAAIERVRGLAGRRGVDGLEINPVTSIDPEHRRIDIDLATEVRR